MKLQASLMRTSVRFVLVAAMAGLFCSTVFAQASANKGQITGTVYDQKDAVIPNAKVTVKGTETGVQRELQSGADGVFRALLLDPGSYTLTVDAQGFATASLTNVVVNVGSSVGLKVTLQLGSTSQSVEVGESLIQLDLPAPTSLLDSRAIESLPINGRRFQDFAALTPTVQIDQTRGSISFAGQRGINGNVMVDGTDYNNPFFGGTRGGERSGFVFTIPQTSIQEFQAVTTGYAAEYGRSTGGVLNAISKSGTNAIHGEVFYQIRHKEIGLSTPFNTQNLETLQQFGGGAGGAIKRDKLFWFAAAERQLSKLPRQVFFQSLVGVAPTTANQEALNFLLGQQGPISSTNDGTATTGRIDYQMANGSRLTARLNFSDANANNAITSGAPLPAIDTRALSGSGSEKDRTYTGVAQYTAILSPRIANDLRFAGTHEVRPRTANTAIPNVNASPIGNFGARNFLPTVQDDTRYQINDGLSMTVGSHTFKLGGDYNYLTTYQSFGFNQFGSISFGTSDVATLLRVMSTAPGQNRFDDSSVRYTFNVGNLLADYHMHQIAFYAQDSWKVNSQLSINYGLRWEGQLNPEAVATNTPVVQAIQNATFPIASKFNPAQLQNNLNQWMPRFGFTYSPFKGSTKTVIRGHAGLFYAATPMLTYGGSTNNFRSTPGDVSFQCNPGSCGGTVYQLFKTAGVDLNTAKLDNLPILTSTQVTNAAATLLGTAPNPFLGAGFTGTANDFQNPRALQLGIGFDQEITKGWVGGVQFNYINTVHLERNRDYNLPTCTVRPADGRCIYTRASRPLTQYGQITMRESSGRSLYRGVTFSSRYSASKKLQFGIQYTLATNYSDDDNERSATGFGYDNAANLRAEYGYSAIDIRHNFASYAVTSLPWGIEVSGIFRANSGQPIDPYAGSDINGDAASGYFASNNDRAYQAPGVPFARNSFRNYGFKTVDIRFLKSFQIGEKAKLQFSTEMFNLFNFDNVILGPASLNTGTLIYGPGVCGSASCTVTGSSTTYTLGQVMPANSTFMQLRNTDGTYNRNNSQLGTPFQAQFGLRFIF
ncbi:MAG: carboxypeptidase regulatory-like domain-containing protein [Bryobacteraceae bacterium]